MSRGLYGAAGGIREGASGLCAALRKAESAGDSDTSGVVAGETSALVGISSATSAKAERGGRGCEASVGGELAGGAAAGGVSGGRAAASGVFMALSGG